MPQIVTEVVLPEIIQVTPVTEEITVSVVDDSIDTVVSVVESQILNVNVTTPVIETVTVFQGWQGEPGEQGDEGLSAYEVAVLNGFEGTEAEWLATLVGPPGEASSGPHAETHATGGEDELTPADIGAETPAGAQAKVDTHAGDATAAHAASAISVTPYSILDADDAQEALNELVDEIVSQADMLATEMSTRAIVDGSLDGRLDAVEAALPGKADDADITALDGRLDTVEAALPGKADDADIAALDTRVDALETTDHSTHAIADVTGLNDALAAKADDSEITALDGRLDTVEAALPGKADDSDVAALDTRLDAVETALPGKADDADITGLDTRLDAVEAALPGKADDADITSLDARVDTLEAHTHAPAWEEVTQAEYDALTPDPDTLYIVID